MALVDRERVCALEVWVEALGGDIKNMRAQDTKEINAVIATMPEWKKSKSVLRFNQDYGVQRGFVRQ